VKVLLLQCYLVFKLNFSLVTVTTGVADHGVTRANKISVVIWEQVTLQGQIFREGEFNVTPTGVTPDRRMNGAIAALYTCHYIFSYEELNDFFYCILS